MLLSGIFPPITTPFYPDGNLYFKKLEANVDRYSRTPVSGIVVLGSTGEAILLSDEERRAALKVAREATAHNKVLVAGTGIESAVETLRLTEIPLPEGSRPRRLTNNPDGSIYYSDFARGYIGRLDPATGKISEWKSPRAMACTIRS